MQAGNASPESKAKPKRRGFRAPFAWATLYGVTLVLAATFVLLDAFAIEKVESVQLEADMSSIVAAQGEASEVADASKASASANNTSAAETASASAASSGSLAASDNANVAADGSDSSSAADEASGSGEESASSASAASSGSSAAFRSRSGDDSASSRSAKPGAAPSGKGKRRSSDSDASASSSSSSSSSADSTSKSRGSKLSAAGGKGSSKSTTEEVDPAQVSSSASSAIASAQESKSATADGVNVSLTETTAFGTHVYLAEVEVDSAANLMTALAQGKFGRNVKESTSDMAERSDAVLAVNGDYYGFRDEGYVVRNGVLYRDTPASGTDALVIYGNGTMASVSQDEVSAQELVADGAWQVLSFGPTLIENGEVAVDQNDEVDQAMGSNPRTAIGMIDPLHYVVVVTDGRTSESEGVTLYELAEIMRQAGCTYAYNLDGGGSTTMWFDGEIVNNPTSGNRSGEREVSDIVYFG